MPAGEIKSIADAQRNLKNFEIKRGKWRVALFKACERIEAEDGVPGPEPKAIIDKLAYRFVQKVLHAETVDWYRELADRLDGKPPQAVFAQGADGEKLDGIKVIFVGNSG